MKQDVKVSLNQNFVLSQELSLGLKVLQMPISQLSDWIEDVVAENPELEFTKSHISKAPKREIILPSNEQILESNPSLYETMMLQVKEEFPEDEKIASEILGNLDENGFYPFEITDDKALSILTKIQRLTPVGIGAKDVQEALLLQLLDKGKEKSLGYTILENHYEDLLHNRKSTLCKALHISEKRLTTIIKEDISPLTPFPGRGFSLFQNPIITPECKITYEDSKWHILYRSEDYPSIMLKPSLKESHHQKEGKWLIHSLWQRKANIEKIIKLIITIQEDYLLEKISAPEPMTHTYLAKKLEMNISTISRAVQGKYIDTPLGFLPFSHFFSQSIGNSKNSEISIERAKVLLKALISKEDHSKPYPDEILATLLKREGILCSRRTVTKYRLKLQIPSANKRKIEFN